MSESGKINSSQSKTEGCDDNGQRAKNRGISGAGVGRSPFIAASLISIVVAHTLAGGNTSALANANSMNSMIPRALQLESDVPMVLAQATPANTGSGVNTAINTTTTTSSNSTMMLQTRELMAADEREIDAMAARIKEMIAARYRAETLHSTSLQTINELRQQIADLEQRLDDANNSFDALLAERDALTQQLSLVQAERDSAREDIDVLAAEVDNQRGAVETLQADVASATDELADKKAIVAELSDKLDVEQATGEQIETSLAATEDKLKDKGRQLALAEERLADARQQLQNLRGQLADLKTDRNNALQEIASLRLERDSADQRANSLLSERENLTGKLGLFESRSNEVSSALQAEQEHHAKTRGTVAALENDIEGLQGDVLAATNHRDELLEEKARLLGEKADLTVDLDKVRGKLRFANEQLGDRQKELQVTEGELKDVTGQLNAAHAELEDLNGQLMSANNEISKLNSHIGKLDSRIASLSADHDDAKASIHALKSDGTTLQGQLEKARKIAASQLAAAQTDLKNQKEALQDQIDRRDRDLLLLNGRVSELTAELSDVTAQAADDVNGRDAQIAALRAQLNELNETQAQLLAEGERATDTMENLHNLIASLEAKEKSTAGKLAELQQQYAVLRGKGLDEVDGLAEKLSESEEKLRLATTQLNELLMEKRMVEAERDAVFSEAEKLRIALTDELREAKLENVTVQKARADNSIPLRLGNADFFAVGSAELTREGGDNLKKLAEIISTFADRRIVVEGHTDNVQIGQRLKSRFISNWELSVARAAAAVRHMQYQSNIDPHQLSAVGYGEYAPVASNDSEEGRQLNRRVEVVLYPRRVTEQQFSAMED